MKNDLATSIIIAIVGTLLAFFLCNFLVGEIEPVSVKVINGSYGAEVADPDPEVFNYKAINPTVEVYVGDGENDNCSQYDSEGNCITGSNQNTPDENSGQKDE